MSEPISLLVRRFERHCKALNQVLKEFRKIHPEGCMYLAGSLHLMTGPHHDDRSNSELRSGEHARTYRILASANLDADGGDW